MKNIIISFRFVTDKKIVDTKNKTRFVRLSTLLKCTQHSNKEPLDVFTYKFLELIMATVIIFFFTGHSLQI